ncbi:regulatory associated protein of MTOR [Cyanidiococcus yangmingshanensis]|uniref:Regulatory associated protein of MTOR n=1 Tax=Cyanidiococcus yangmingshanensis TaxID=2690220 RepID=A0A7J7IGN5_9RHOD|nr:regulatory associated protein of MTOR [Cyanidiococcus yangmingshanensis]
MGVEPCTPSLIQTGTSMRRDSEEASRLRERWVCRLEQGGDIWALTFHPTQPLVLVGDALGRVTALDREHGSLHWSFRVPRAEGGITALHVVNAHTTWPVLLVATADGTIRVYESQMQLLAAFAAISRPTEARSSGEAEAPYRHERGLEGVSVSPSAAASDAPDPSRLIPTAPTRFEDKHRNEHNTTAALHTSSSTSDSPEVKPYTSGIQTTSISTTSSMTGRVDHAPPAGRSFVCDWSPWHGWLLSGGLEQGTIRLFDAEREMCIWSCIASSYQVTAVAHIRPDLFMVGCADGAVYGYDARTGAAELELLEHSSPVLAIEGRASPTPALVTAAAAGDVRIWPEMASDSAVCVVAHRRDLTATAVHRNLPWMATGSASRSIKLFGEQGQLMKLIRHHDGPDAARIGPVSCLKFDETSPLLAAGDMDSVVTLYADRVESIRQMAS